MLSPLFTRDLNESTKQSNATDREVQIGKS
jgi:hypothetical protein